MKKTFEAMKREPRLAWGRKAGVILGVLASCWGVMAGEYVWTGAADGYWTNAANWTVGGVVAPQPPGQLGPKDEVIGGSLGDTAVFSQASANTTIDLDGLHSIKDVTVTGASTPAYTFGTSSSQTLHLESNSTILVDSSVTAMPLFPCGIGLVTDGTTVAFEPTIQNDAAQTLVLNKLGYVTKVAGAPGWLETHLTLAGTGDFRLAGTPNNEMSGWSLKPTFMVGGTITVAADWTNLHGLVLSRSTGNIVVLENATIALADSWSSLVVSYDAQIIGTGTLRMGSNARSGVWTDADINIGGARTLTLGENVTLTNSKSDDVWHGSAYRTNDGTLAINGSNTMPGPLKMHRGTTRVTSIAQLGGVATGEALIVLRGGARLVYAGAGETVARTVVMTNGAAIVEQAGTGPLVMTGDLQTLSGSTGRLTLVNDSDAAATWSGAIPAAVTGVTVEGATGWTLSGANAVTALTIAGGSALCLTGDAAAAGGTTVSTGTSGVSTLRVLDGETVTLAGLTSAGGTLNVVTEGSGKVVVPGQSGTAPGWLFLNGKNSEYADGTLVVASYATTTSIAARGDVVPNGASEMVGITTSGSGGADTLAADSTVVAGLVQKSDTPAVIDLAANQTLTAGMLAINEGKAPLTIGATDGTGTLASGSGTFIVDNENPSADLTVRASADLSASTTLDKRGEGALRFTGTVAPWTGTMALNAGEVAFANDEQPAPTFALSGVGTFAKEATNDWTLTRAQPDFMGELVLRGGVTRLGSTGLVLGSTAATLTITNGAALDLSGGLTDGTFSALRFGKRHVRIAGAGPDGLGVIRPEGFDTVSNPEVGSTNMNNGLFNGTRITLLDDATMGLGTAGAVRYGFTSSVVVDQQFHTLTITNAGTWEMNMITFTNAGPIVIAPSDNSSINFLMEIDTSLGGPDAPPITTYANTKFTFANGVAAQWRPLNVLSNLTFYNWHQYSPDDPGCNAWSGPVNLVNPESRVALNVYSDTKRTLRFNGQVSGPGGITTSGSGRFFFSHPSNTWTGASSFGANNWPGFWQFDYADSLPVYSNATFASGVARLPMGTGDRWPADRLADFLNEANMAGNTVVELDTTEGDARLDYAQRAVTNAMKGTLRNGGTGKLVVSGPLEFPGNLAFNSAWTGTVEITGSETVSINSAKPLASSSSDFPTTLHLRNATDVQMGTTGFVFSEMAGKYGWIKVENSRIVYDDYVTKTDGIRLGNNGTDIMEIVGDGTVLTNLIRLGSNSGRAAVYQRGGNVGNVGSDGLHYGVIGNGGYGYGYYELSGGFYSMMGGQRIGFNNRAAGVLAILGGEAACADSPAGNTTALNLGVDNSVGVLYMKGGTLDMGSTPIGICEWNNSHKNGIGVVTLDGADAKLVHPASCVRLGVSQDATAIINLNAGVFETRAIGKSQPTAGETWAGARVYVNLGGGTLKARPEDANLFVTGVAAVDRITAFAGGAVIDTAGADRTLDLPVLAPEGMGVASVDGTGVVGETFVGSPVIVIENTDGSEGYGATAYAEFDSATRKVTGIRITSPGCNYTSAQAVIRYGAPWLTNAVTLAASASGGLTKKGAGTLTLNATNTFTGPIAVEQGTLKIGDNGSVQDGSALAIAAGGTLDLNGKSYTCSSIAQYGGAVANGTLTLPASLTVDLADVKAGNKMTFQSGSFAFPANATLTVLNAELLDRNEATYTLLQITDSGSFANLPRLTNDDLGHWRLSLGNGNREIRLAFPRGTLMIFK